MATHTTSLTAEKRTRLGTAEARRLRRRGLIPGNIYGHGTESTAIMAPEEVVRRLVESGARLVQLNVDGASERAVIREIQWDALGSRILHFDLLRVSAHEVVTVEVPVELRGVSPGAEHGGVLEQPLRSITVECRSDSIPEHIEVRIHELNVGDAIHVGDLTLPDGVKALNPADAVVVHVAHPVGEAALEEAELPSAAEPELVRREGKQEEAAE